ncbi:MAG: hypothetical protein ACRELF_03515 [Gemmataceae bacterium]
MADLKAELARSPKAATRGARLIQEAQAQRAAVVAGWRKFMEEFGIQGEPIGAKKLRELLIQHGVNPEANEFSREIIAMREE